MYFMRLITNGVVGRRGLTSYVLTRVPKMYLIYCKIYNNFKT